MKTSRRTLKYNKTVDVTFHIVSLSNESWSMRMTGYHVYRAAKERDATREQWGSACKKGRIFDTLELAIRYVRRCINHTKREGYKSITCRIHGHCLKKAKKIIADLRQEIIGFRSDIFGLIASAKSMDKHNRILNERLNTSLRTSDALTEALKQCQDELDRERELHTRALEQADGLMVNNQILRKQLRERSNET